MSGSFCPLFISVALASLGTAEPLLVRDLPGRVPVAIRTWAGDSALRSAVATPEEQPVLLVLGTPATSAHADEIRSAVLGYAAAVRGKIRPFRLAVWTSQGMQFAGPFKTRAQLDSALREMANLAASAPLSLSPEQFWSNLPAAAAQAGSNWVPVLVIGEVPALAPAVADYAAAFASSRLRNQRVRASFWPFSQGESEPARAIAHSTAGAVVESLSLWADLLSAADQRWLELAAGGPRVNTGFVADRALLLDAQGQTIDTAPYVWSAPGFDLPDIERYARMVQQRDAAATSAAAGDDSAARRALAEALAISPRDSKALRLAADLAEKGGDHAAAANALIVLAEMGRPAPALLAETGSELYASGNRAAAESYLARAREAGVADALLSERLARIRLERKDVAGAMPLMDESLKLDPSDQSLWFDRAGAAEALNQPAEQASSLEKALALGGDFIDRRTALIRLYIAQNRPDDALRHVRAVAAKLPADAALRSAYAGFFETLRQPAEALDAWKRVLEADAKYEPAYIGIVGILAAGGRHADALAAANQGIEACPSGRLHVARASAQEALGDLYGARRTLKAAVQAVPSDLLVLRRRAAVEDAMGAEAPQAYEAYAAALEKSGDRGELERALVRGLDTALRAGDSTRGRAFAAKLSALGKPDYTKWLGESKNRRPGRTITPGGVATLIYIAQGKDPTSAESTLTEHCRRVIAAASDPPKVFEAYQLSVKEHFARIAALSAFGARNNSSVVVHLAATDKKSRQRTEKILSVIGWKLHSRKNGVTVEAAAKAEAAKRQETVSALGFDENAMKDALDAGKPFDIEIPYESVPAFPEESVWKAAFWPSENIPGGLAEAVVRDPRLARLYVGLNTASIETARALIDAVGLKPLAEKYSTLLERYAAALAVRERRVAVPGGPAAEAIWTRQVGASPSDPGEFFRALLERDHGQALAYYATLAQLDSAHQRFFTRTPSRAKRFYELFGSEMQNGSAAGHLQRDSSFLSFLQDVPLTEDGGVDFPGSPEVWMVAKGRSNSAARTTKLLRKLKKTAAPDVEDDILIRLATTRYKVGVLRRSELENFLAVVHIDAHRDDPLDEPSALALAQNYTQYESFYPYFAVYTGLRYREFERFFQMGDTLRPLDEAPLNFALADIHSLLAAGSLALEAGTIDDKRATELFFEVCDAFAKAAPNAHGAVALNLSRTLLDKAGLDRTDPDAAIRALLLGPARQAGVQIAGTRVEGGSQRRHDEFKAVLESQRSPKLADLYRIQESALAIAARKEPPAERLKTLDASIAAIPAADAPAKVKMDGRQKAVLSSYRTDKLAALAAEFRQKLSKKKVNPKDLDKIAQDILAEVAPQVSVALASQIYGFYLRPDDLVVAGDPMLVRKHHYIDLAAPRKTSDEYPSSRFVKTSESIGSRFLGGLADFSTGAGFAASVGLIGDAGSEPLIASQMSAMRATDWSRFRDDDAALFGARLRVAREWIVRAAFDRQAAEALADDTLGLLSLQRRVELLNAIDARDWTAVWKPLTMSDLFHLSEKYLARYPKGGWDSPAVRELRALAERNDGDRLNLLGPTLRNIYDCSHPHLLPLAPYEDYERYLMPGKLAERAADLKLYIADLLDREALPAAALGAVADQVASATLKSLKMTDMRDWRSQASAFAALDAKMFEAAVAGMR